MALKTPVRVFRKTFPSGTSKTIDFAEAGFTTPLDNTHLILAFIFVASTTVATFPGTWTPIYGGSTGNGPTQLRLIAMQGDGSTNSLTIGTASAIGSITLVAYPDFVSLTPITAAVSTNVTTSTATYNLPDFGSGTANGILFDVIGGPATFVGATYNRGTLVGDLDANGQMILAQEYTDGTADQSITVTMPSARQGRYSQVVMPIGVGSAPADATMTATPTDAAADGGTAAMGGATGGTMSATPAGDVKAGISDGWPETWPDAFGPVPAYMTGAASVAVTAGDTAADGGSALLVGAASAAIVAAATDVTADGGMVTLAGAASAIIAATSTDAVAAGGSASLAGAASATIETGQGDAAADGGSALLVGAATGSMVATAADANAVGADAFLSAIASGAPLWSVGFEDGNPFVNGPTSLDAITTAVARSGTSSLYSAGSSSLAHRIRYASQTFAMGTILRGWVRVGTGSPRLAGISFMLPDTTDNFAVLIDTRNLSSSSAGFQISENRQSGSVATSGVAPSEAVQAERWYLIEAIYDATTVTARLYRDDYAQIATLTRTLTAVMPPASYRPAIYSYGDTWHDDIAVSPVVAATIQGTEGGAAANGGSAILVGGFASTLTATSGSATAEGLDGAIVGGATGTMAANAGGATADGGVVVISGSGSLSVSASDAAASGGTVVFAGGAAATLNVLSAGAMVDGGVSALLVGPAVVILGSHTFVISPWADGAGHDVELHKRRAYAEITGRPLSRGRVAGMTGPTVAVADNIARVTYTLIG